MAKSIEKTDAKKEDDAGDAVRFRAPELDGGVAWLNTAGPLRLRDLRGKIVLLDFWTLCCINCMHMLPDLAKLEEKYCFEQALRVGLKAVLVSVRELRGIGITPDAIVCRTQKSLCTGIFARFEPPAKKKKRTAPRSRIRVETSAPSH